MPCVDNIDVRVIVDGKPAHEYSDPDEEDDSPHIQRRYIEVKAGQEFTVEIKWQVGFRVESALHLYASLHFDDRSFYHYCDVEVDRESTRTGLLNKTEIRRYKNVTTLDGASGQWHTCPFTFGALSITADENTGTTITPEKIASLGLIKLKCYRARKIKKKEPSYWTGIMAEATDNLSEKALKGKLLKNNVRFLPNSPITHRTRAHHYDYLPTAGESGKVYEFHFLYRSRNILQTLGCIPRSPSPPPDPQFMLERTEDMLKIAKQREREANLRILELQNRLARSESGTSTLIDLDGHNSNGIKKEHEMDNIKIEINANAVDIRGTKRPRDDDDDDLTEIAPLQQKPRIEIDLTEDD